MASSDSAKAYIFNRDYRSSVRYGFCFFPLIFEYPEMSEVQRSQLTHNSLNLNHWITKGLTGYLLHPKVAYPENAVIADIGTGTA